MGGRHVKGCQGLCNSLGRVWNVSAALLGGGISRNTRTFTRDMCCADRNSTNLMPLSSRVRLLGLRQKGSAAAAKAMANGMFGGRLET